MKTANKNPIANMVDTLANPKGKTDKKPVAIPDIQIIEMASSVAEAYTGFMSASDSLNAVVQSIVKTGFKPVDLRKAKKDSIEYKQTTQFKSTFIDTVMAKGITKRTAGDYYELVAKAIKGDKEITSTNPRSGKGKGKPASQKSTGGNDDNAKMVSALLNVWKLSDVATESLTKIESSIDNGMTLIEAITDYLESEGIDLSSNETE